VPPDPHRFDDLFAPFGGVALRRMFGGEGLFRDRLMFGLLYRERIYFKTSEETRNNFISEGSAPFTYPTKAGRGILTSYYELPDRLYDDPDALAEWARIALGVAKNAPAAKKKRNATKDKAAKKRA
jgi:DNA transformation protein and related proteins